MNYGLYMSASGVLTNMHRQDVAAANLANVATTGFKRSLTALQNRPVEATHVADGRLSNALLDKLGGGVFVRPTQLDLEPGRYESTGNDFDLALDGRAFFLVRDNTGSQVHQRLTRDGRFTLAADGRLVTTTGGHAVLDAGGQPITLDIEAGFQVDQQGNVIQGGSAVAQLRLIDPPADRIRHAGLGLYEAPDAVIRNAPQADAVVRQGHLEGSNVDSVREMLNLMSASRAVSGSANLIRYHDSIMDRAVNVLGRVA